MPFNLEIRATPPAPPWTGPDFQRFGSFRGSRELGFLVWRQIAPDEFELLDLFTEPACRRNGIGRALLDRLLREAHGTVYLEVRESNVAARELYRSAGFKEIGRRAEYYTEPVETAIVMKFYS